MRERIGRYELQAELGRGGFGQVFRAHDPIVGRAVAIKILLGTDDPELLVRFRNEAGATGKLRHRNIVVIYDFGEQEGSPYLVMELLEGQDLERIVSHRQPMSLLQKVDVIRQMACGLQHAHSLGIVHRDIKPANIMLLGDGTVKIMDFGIALLNQTTAARITPQGSLIGTFPYMSPEQFQGEASDSLTDIFALGVTCYKILTGVHPFQAPEMAAVMFNIVNKTPEPIRSLVPECPEALENVISRLLAKDRESRYQNLEDTVFDLEPIGVDLRRERVQELVANAKDSIARDELRQAQEFVREALEIEPGFRAARELREQLQQLIKEKTVRPKVAALVEAGRRFLQDHSYDRAIEQFESALKLDRSNTDIKQLISEAQTAWERRRRADRFAKEAQQALAADDLTAAKKNAAEALSAFPQHQSAQKLLNDVQEKLEKRERASQLRDGLSHAKGLVLVGSFDTALDLLGSLQNNFPDSAEVRKLSDEARTGREKRTREEALRNATENAKRILQEQRFSEAKGVLAELVERFPESSELRSLLAFASEELRSREEASAIAQVSSRARELIANGSYEQAVENLRAALAQFPQAGGLRELLHSAESGRAERARADALEQTVSEAQKLIARRAYTQALDKIAAFTAAYDDAPVLAPLRRSAEQEQEKLRRVSAVRKLLLEAQGLIDEGRPGTASHLLQQATVQFPGEADIKTLLNVAHDRAKEQRDAEDVSKIISEAESLARSRRFDSALQILDEGTARHPQEKRLQRCREAVAAAKQGFEQQKKLDDVLADATKLASEKQFEPALKLLADAATALGEKPTISKLRSEIQAQLAAEKQREAARQRIAEAQSLMDGGDPLSATRILEGFSAGDPEATRLMTVAKDRMRDQAEKAQKAEMARLAATEALAKLLERASSLAGGGRFAEALRLLDSSDASVTREPSVVALRAQIERNYEISRLAAQAENLRIARDLNGAIAVVAEGLTRYVGEGSLLEIRQRIENDRAEEQKQQAIQKLLDHAQVLREQRHWESALAFLTDSQVRFPDDPRIVQARREAEREVAADRRARALDSARSEAETYVNAQEFTKAISLIEKTEGGTESLGDILARARTLQSQKAGNDMLAEAYRLCDDGRFDEALSTVKRAIVQFGTSPAASELRDRLENEVALERRRTEYNTALLRLRSLIEETSKPPYRKKGLTDAYREAKEIQASHPADAEISDLAARVGANVEPGFARIRKLQVRIALAVASGLVVMGAAWLLYRAPQPVKPVQVEIRTDPQGASVVVGSRSCVTPGCRLDLTPGQYQLKAQLQGYQPVQRNVMIVEGQSYAADLVLQPVPPPVAPVTAKGTGTLSVQTGQPGVLVSVDGTPRGRTDASGKFSIQLPADTHSVRAEKNGFQTIGERNVTVEKDGTRSVLLAMTQIPSAPVEAPKETPAPVPVPAPVEKAPSAEQLAEQDWQKAYASHDAAQLRAFLGSHPGSSHAADAQMAMDDLDWSRVNTSDQHALSSYLSQYPAGRHVGEAKARMADLAWINLDKSNEQALRQYVQEYPDGARRHEAENMVASIEAKNAAVANQKAELASKEQHAGTGQTAELFGIDSALDQFNAAFKRKQPRDLKKIWPTVPTQYTEAMRLSGTTFTMALKPVEQAQVSGDSASIMCDLLTTTTVRGQSNEGRKRVKVRLQKAGEAWSILDPLGS